MLKCWLFTQQGSMFYAAFFFTKHVQIEPENVALLARSISEEHSRPSSERGRPIGVSAAAVASSPLQVWVVAHSRSSAL